MIFDNAAGSLNQRGGNHRERQMGITPMFRVDRPVKMWDTYLKKKANKQTKKPTTDLIIESFGFLKQLQFRHPLC